MERASLKWRNLDGNRSLFSHESEKNEIPQSLSPSLLPFVVSCDEVLGNEVKVVLQNLAGSLAKKSGKSYSETSNFMKSRMFIAIVRATDQCKHELNEQTSPVGRWSRPQLVLPLDEQQTYISKLNKKAHAEIGGLNLQ